MLPLRMNVHVVSAIGKRNPAVSRIYLLKRMTEELKKIQTLTYQQLSHATSSSLYATYAAGCNVIFVVAAVLMLRSS